MSKTGRRNGAALRSGEIVRVSFVSGLVPDGIYRVDVATSSFIALSAGEIRIGVPRSDANVIERHLLEPKSWLPFEVAVLKKQAEICDCARCREELKRKEALLSVATGDGEIVH